MPALPFTDAGTGATIEYRGGQFYVTVQVEHKVQVAWDGSERVKVRQHLVASRSRAARADTLTDDVLLRHCCGTAAALLRYQPTVPTLTGFPLYMRLPGTAACVCHR